VERGVEDREAVLARHHVGRDLGVVAASRSRLRHGFETGGVGTSGGGASAARSRRGVAEGAEPAKAIAARLALGDMGREAGPLVGLLGHEEREEQIPRVRTRAHAVTDPGWASAKESPLAVDER
jgi:hypothetical protein